LGIRRRRIDGQAGLATHARTGHTATTPIGSTPSPLRMVKVAVALGIPLAEKIGAQHRE
jgi:hypothetical protein